MLSDKGTSFRRVALFAASLLFALPVAVMVIGSLGEPGRPSPVGLDILRRPPSLASYRLAFSASPLARSLANSAIIAGIFVVTSVLSSAMAGYFISQMTPRSRRIVISSLVVLMMVPLTFIWIPRFVMFKQLGMIDTWWPLILPGIAGGSPLLLLLQVLGMSQIPSEVIEAARLEGAGEARIWWRIALPATKRMSLAVAFLAFVQSWNNFIDPLLFLGTEARYTAPLALRYLQQLGPTNLPVLLAAAAILTAPVASLLFIGQRKLLERREV